MRTYVGVPIHYSFAEIQVRSTDRLHRAKTNEHTNDQKNADIDRKEA